MCYIYLYVHVVSDLAITIAVLLAAMICYGL